MTVRRCRLGALVLALVCASTSCAAGARTDFVGRDQLEFTVDGEPSPLLGINIYNAASRGNCWYDMRTALDAALTRISDATEGRANVIRVWFFQRLALRDGQRDWSQLDRVVAAARAHGFRVIPVLADQWGACEGRGGSGGPYKDVTWYEGGYTEPEPGGDGTVSFRRWAQEVVSRYRDDPTIALWSLVNEAEARSRRSGPCPPTAHEALAGFAEDMGSVVKGIDPDHLLGLGTIGGGQCGASGPEYKELHAFSTIDFCEYHDYDVPPLPGDATNGLAARLQECSDLGKPLLVGETGVVPDEVGGLDARADTFRVKLAAQTSAGAAGFLLWGWSASGYGTDDEYGIGPHDPSLTVLAD